MSTVFGEGVKVEIREQQINALKGWRIGDLARVRETTHVSSVEFLVSHNLTLTLAESDPNTRRYAHSPEELVNLSRPG